MENISPENKKLAAACAVTALTVGTLSTFITAQRQKRSHARQSVTEAAAALAALKDTTSPTPSTSNQSNNNTNNNNNKNNNNKEKEKTSVEIYESVESARQYMEFHFTPSRDSYVMKLRTISESYDFPTRVAQKFKVYLPAVTAAAATVRSAGASLTDASSNSNNTSSNNKPLLGLDLGCATGASVFEMSKYFDHVVGLDYSRAFIELANEVKASGAAAFNNKNKKVAYHAVVQGDLSEARETAAPRNTFPERCEFVVGDATHLFAPAAKGLYTVPDGVTFDGVLCVNLLDRVPDPMVVLTAFSRLLHRRGVLVLCDPYSWTESATPKQKWLGAVNADGAAKAPNPFAGRKSEDVVKEVLSKDFELRTETEEPFLIRDHVRHYQLGFSHCTVWIRK